VLRLLWAVDHVLQKTSKRMEGTLGVTAPQRLVLRLLGRFPGVTAGRLAELMLVHASTVSVILKRLLQRGLVERRADTRDRRRAFLGLTEAGRALNADLPGTVEAAVKTVLAKLPADHVAHTQAMLVAVAAALDAQLREPAPAGRRGSQSRT
jgi:DNA-binding MarR family transcriptional regulator